MINTPISWPGALVALTASLAVTSPAPRWPEAKRHASFAAMTSAPAAAPAPLPSAKHEDELRIERQTVCIAQQSWSAGALGDTVLYRARREGRKLQVGYFVHWSTERPWGNN